MNGKLDFLDIWAGIAATLFSQALSAEPDFIESLPKPMPQGSQAYAAQIEGELAGRFLITLDAGLLEAALLGEGVDQGTAWFELLRETVEATLGEMVARGGMKVRMASFERCAPEGSITRAFQLKTVERSWVVTVRDEIKEAKLQAAAPAAEARQASKPASTEAQQKPGEKTSGGQAGTAAAATGFDLLLDVELEASLRFGAREMPLGEILELGPGDVVQLDRNIADPVDLLVGDKIVARGEVVLVNGSFALRVLEVAEPQRRLESVRCLF